METTGRVKAQYTDALITEVLVPAGGKYCTMQQYDGNRFKEADDWGYRLSTRISNNRSKLFESIGVCC